MGTTKSANRIEIVYPADAIARRLDQLAGEIAARQIPGLLVIAVLKGSFVFAADLIRALNRAGLAPEVDFLTLSSYKKNRISSGQVSILRDLDLEVEGRNVLLVDDVLDSGRTLAFAKDLDCGARRQRHLDLRTAGKGSPACRQHHRRLPRLCLPRHVCCWLRHGCRASLSGIAVRWPPDGLRLVGGSSGGAD